MELGFHALNFTNKNKLQGNTSKVIFTKHATLLHLCALNRYLLIHKGLFYHLSPYLKGFENNSLTYLL